MLPVLVFVNPHSGTKKSLHIFQEVLQPLLNDFGLSFELFVTQRAKEAQEYIQSVENVSEKYSTIVIVSGDGLLFEVIQGLLSRKDYKSQTRQKVAFSIVPAGSGNGLAKSLSFFNSEPLDCLQSCLNVVSGKQKLMDLVRVQTATGEVFHSFLSIGWGLTSDCDIESECLRCLGESRFMLYSIKLLLELRSYRAKVTYKVFGQSEVTETEDDFVIVYSVKQPWATNSFFMAPSAQLDDGKMWLLLVRRKRVNRLSFLKIMLGFNSGNHVNLDGVEMIPVTYFKLEPLSSGSYITIDGEILEEQKEVPRKIEAEIVPKELNILLK